MDLNRDELRRQVRDLDRLQQQSTKAQASLTNAALESLPADERATFFLPHFDRRGFLRVGGIAVAASTVLAACRNPKAKKQLPVTGENPGYKPLADKPVDDVVLLRTASSLEWSVIDAYRKIIDNGFIEDAAVTDVLKVFADHHAAHAGVFADATKSLGGTACTSLNEKITGYLIDPLLQEIAANKDGRSEDSKALAFALETLAAATYQSVVPSLTQPSLRRAAMSVGGVEARHAALLGAVLNPTMLVPGAEGTPATTVAGQVPTAASANNIHAVPTAFGALSPYPLTVGAANENGVRKTTNIETPSLNSLMYADEAC